MKKIQIYYIIDSVPDVINFQIPKRIRSFPEKNEQSTQGFYDGEKNNSLF